MKMCWQELMHVVNEKEIDNESFQYESVTVYDRSTGDFYPADTIEFEESDGIIDAGHLFIEIQTREEDEEIES